MTPNMRLFLACLLIVAGSMAAYVASAAEVTLTCTPPTKYTDGSNITDPITYTAHHGASAAVLDGAVNLGSTCGGKIAVADPPAGQSVTRFFAVRAHVNGTQSALSEIVSKTVTTPLPTPNPPTDLTVGEETTAYVIKQTRDNIALVAVGQVPPGTQCNAAKGVITEGKAYNIVPREAVTWAGSVQSEIVLAACSG